MITDFLWIAFLCFFCFVAGFGICQWLEARHMKQLAGLIVDEMMERLMELIVQVADKQEEEQEDSPFYSEM